MTTKTKTKTPSKKQALSFALYLAVCAPDTKRSKQALAIAFEIANGMTKKQVDDAKSWSLKTASPEKLEQAIEWFKGLSR
jgi:hypothetical protein